MTAVGFQHGHIDHVTENQELETKKNTIKPLYYYSNSIDLPRSYTLKKSKNVQKACVIQENVLSVTLGWGCPKVYS